MRDVEKAVEEYKKTFWDNTQRGKFYLSDCHQIDKLSKGEKWECINNALMFGFITGYRLAKREQRH